MRLISKLLATIVFGGIACLAASPIAAVFVKDGNSNFVLFIVFALVALAAFFAPTGRRAWGRGSLIAGVLFIALPLTVAGLSADIGNTMIQEAAESDQAATAVGATLGAGIMVGASAFIGFIFGAILLSLGFVLVLGGRREVVVVKDRL